LGRKPLAGQLALGLFHEEPVPAALPRLREKAKLVNKTTKPVAATFLGPTVPGPLDFIPHETATREERIMLALRRDLATLSGPPEYVCEREFYESRIAGYREMLHDTQNTCPQNSAVFGQIGGA
jgi:hypothetical protein